MEAAGARLVHGKPGRVPSEAPAAWRAGGGTGEACPACLPRAPMPASDSRQPRGPAWELWRSAGVCRAPQASPRLRGRSQAPQGRPMPPWRDGRKARRWHGAEPALGAGRALPSLRPGPAEGGIQGPSRAGPCPPQAAELRHLSGMQFQVLRLPSPAPLPRSARARPARAADLQGSPSPVTREARPGGRQCLRARGRGSSRAS